METIGIIVAVMGGICAWSPWTLDRFMLSEIAAVSAGVVLLWLGILLRRKGPQKCPGALNFLDVIIPAFLLVNLISLCTSIDKPMSLLGFYMTPAGGVLQLVLLSALAYGVCHSAVKNRNILGVALLALVVLAIVGVLEHVGILAAKFGVYHTIDYRVRLCSLAGNPVFLGCCLAMLIQIPIAICISAFRPADPSMDHRPAPTWAVSLSAFILPISLLVLILTISKGALLGAALGAMVTVATSGRVSVRRWMVISAAALFVLAGSLMVYARRGGLSDMGRLETWKIAARSVVQRGPMGSGPDTFALTYRKNQTPRSVEAEGKYIVIQFNAHNDLLQVASTLGAVGLAVYLICCLATFLLVFMGIDFDRTGYIGPACAGGLAAVFFLAKINPVPFSAMVLTAVMLGICASTCDIDMDEGWRPMSRWFPVSVLAVCLGLVYVNGRRVAADFHHLRAMHLWNGGDLVGSANEFARAARLNPFEHKYREAQVKSLFRIPSLATRETGIRVLGDALTAAQENVWLHPNDADAHKIYAGALLVVRHYLGSDSLPFALQEMEKACRLAPLYFPFTRVRDDIAKKISDGGRSPAAMLGPKDVDGWD